MKLVIIAALTLSCLVVNIGAAPAGTNVNYVQHFPSAYTLRPDSDGQWCAGNFHRMGCHEMFR